MTTSTDISTVTANPLITVDTIKVKQLSIIPTFSDTAKVDKLVLKFGAEALSVIPDMSNKKGRDVIKSMAFKVSQTKTGVIAQMIKPSIEQAKKVIAEVGKGKKHSETKMDALRDEVRAPLNKWEADEKIREDKRISDIQIKINGIHLIVKFSPGNEPCKDDITELMESVDSINCEEGFAEFTQDALQAKSKAKEILTEMLNVIIQKEIQDKADEELLLKEQQLDKERLKIKAQERLNNLMMIPVTMFGKTSKELSDKATSITHYPIVESEFGELFEQANIAAKNVIAQLNTMHDQQILVESAQDKKQQEVEKMPFNDSPHYESKSVEQEPVTKIIPEQTRTHSRTVITPLTWHQKMIKQVDFWYSENGSYDDLMSILNQYK